MRQHMQTLRTCTEHAIVNIRTIMDSYCETRRYCETYVRAQEEVCVEVCVCGGGACMYALVQLCVSGVKC